MQQAFSNDDGTKIPRQVTQDLLASVETICQDNHTLRAHLSEFLTVLPAIPAYTPSICSDDGLEWFHDIRRKTLEADDLREIGVC